MNELNQIILATLALVPSLVFAFFSAIGGRDFNLLGVRARIWKRIIAPFSLVSLIIGLALIDHKFNWWLCSLYATYFISCMFGYGADSIFKKVWRRSIWSIIRTLACLPLCILTGSYTLFIIQALLSLLITLGLGVWNPFTAPTEELLINFLSVLFIPFMVL